MKTSATLLVIFTTVLSANASAAFDRQFDVRCSWDSNSPTLTIEAGAGRTKTDIAGYQTAIIEFSSDRSAIVTVAEDELFVHARKKGKIIAGGASAITIAQTANASNLISNHRVFLKDHDQLSCSIL